MTDPIRILFVEDVPYDMELAGIELQKAGIAVVSKRVDKEEELIQALESFLPNLVICDYSMPRFNGMEALTIIKKQDTSIPVIMFTGSQNEMVAVECMKAGASDYILKDTITRLPYAVKEVLEKRALLEARNRLHEEEKSRAEELERLNAELTESRHASLNIMADLNAEIEQKDNARKELTVSETRFKHLFHYMTNGVAIYTPVDNGGDFIFKDINQSGEKLSQVTRDQVLGKRLSEVFPGAMEYGLVDALRKVIKTGQPEFIPIKIYNDSRIQQWVENTIYKLPSDEIVAIYLDTSAREKALEALRNSEEKYKLLFTRMSEGFAIHEIVLDEKGNPVDYRFLEMNPAFEKMTGWKSTDVTGRTVLEAMPGIEKEWITNYGKVALTGKPIKFQQYSKELEKWFSVSAFSPEKGKFATIFTDITGKIKVEHALRESENKFRGIAEQMSDMVYITDMAGLITFISPTSRDIFDYEPEEMVGNHFMMFLDEAQVKLAQEKFRFTVKTGETETELVLTMKRKDGTLFQGELKSTVFMQDNKPIGTMGLIRDITDRLEAEKALKESHQKLRGLTTHIQEVREEERKDIAQNLHDDLGQRLTALNIDLAWLAGRIPIDLPELSEKINGMHGLLLETATRIKQISSQLRPSILDDLGISAAITWQVNEFLLRTDVPCKLSIIPEDIMMPADIGTQVFRIVQEALTNIMRHAEASTVVISLIEKEKQWRLRIKDNGKGFTEEELGEKQSFGLSGIEERTKLCNGTISIKSKPGSGVEIIVEIPIV